MDEPNHQKKKPKKIQGTFVKVNEDNAVEVAKEIMKMIWKGQKPKGH
jgi:hypothetical protein